MTTPPSNFDSVTKVLVDFDWSLDESLVERPVLFSPTRLVAEIGATKSETCGDNTTVVREDSARHFTASGRREELTMSGDTTVPIGANAETTSQRRRSPRMSTPRRCNAVEPASANGDTAVHRDRSPHPSASETSVKPPFAGWDQFPFPEPKTRAEKKWLRAYVQGRLPAQFRAKNKLAYGEKD